MDVLQATNLRKSYRSGAQVVEAVQGVSLSCRAGEVVAFLGANGAGKTTTLKMLTGLIRPDSGEVRICGGDPHADVRVLERIGAVLEGNRNTYWTLTVQENFEYFGVLRGLSRAQVRRRVPGLLEEFDLTDKRHTQVQRLSRGMQQKLAIALAVLPEPQLLLLDEPTLGLDVQATLDMQALVRSLVARGCAVLLTTHQLDVAQKLSDRVVIMRRGQVITEQPTRELLRAYSGSGFDLRFEGTLSEPQRRALLSLGAEEVEPGRLSYFGPGALLYEVLDALRPLELRAVTPGEVDLADVFLRVNSEAEVAYA
ncbi:ATP-binding cassette domain-containing protein [Deinococcus sp. HMF7620]|uniref:ATP-binding cassette domain-containing protein n=1 Tax=Deinococcus arboris TaxID=2682977 RepID=A0A7C9HQ09_9DEIO|nr:ABC transporter ATP-binding protein [Deinococcus arboris]MVN85633.1 ATP-binding cassette domain-containing protein [Deinococcus arboris]